MTSPLVALLARWADLAPDECRAVTMPPGNGYAESEPAWLLLDAASADVIVRYPERADGRALIFWHVLDYARTRWTAHADPLLGAVTCALDMAAPDDDFAAVALEALLEALNPLTS